MPCRHDVCMHCVKQAIELDREPFRCPYDNFETNDLNMFVPNEVLFKKVKTVEASRL